MVDENEMLREVYREAGEQVRNVSTLRNALLTFYVVALAAFIGLLAQGQVPAEKEGVDKLIWLVPVFFSLTGVASILATSAFIQTALRRQEFVASRFLNSGTLADLNLTPRPHYANPWEDPLTKRWWSNQRINHFLYVIYLVPLVASIVFSIRGDPFGLTR